MDDVRDLLTRAAGTPVVPLDLEAVRARGAARRRHRQVLTAAAVVVPVAGAALALTLVGGTSGDSDVLQRASTGPTAAAPSPLASVPPPSTRPSQATPVTDGVVYALITGSDGTTVTWDQVDYRGEGCASEGVDVLAYKAYFEACYSNTSSRLRTAPLDPDVRVLVKPGGDPFRTVGAKDLAREVSAQGSNGIPVEYRTWQLTVRGGTVVAVEQAPAASA